MGEIRTATQRQRDKIRSGMIIGQLHKCVMGEITMSPSQVNAARILLNKTLPDLKSLDVQASIEATLKPTYQLTDDELLAIAGGKVVRLNPPARDTRAIESTAEIIETEQAKKVVNRTQMDDMAAVATEKAIPNVILAPYVDVGF